MRYEKMYDVCKKQLTKSIIVLICLIALCATACRTTKTAKAKNEQILTEVKSDLSKTTGVSDKSLEASSLVDKSITAENIEEIIVETTMSAPDSTGRQYPVSIKTTNRKIAANKQNDITASATQTNDIQKKEVLMDKSKTKMETQAEESETTAVKIKTPLWIIAIIAGIFAVILIVVLLFLKKWRII